MRRFPRQPAPQGQAWKEEKQKIPDTQLPAALTEKMRLLKPYLEKSHDIISRPFYLEGEPRLQAVSIHINNMIDDENLNQHILRPLMLNCQRDSIRELGSQKLIDAIYQTSITLSKISKISTLPDLVQNIFDGMTVLLFDGLNEVLAINIQGGEFRAIDTPPSEQSMRGSREGFVERLDINVALVRRRLRDPKLAVENTVIGRRTRTRAALLYIEDVADSKTVAEVKARMDRIDIDGIVSSGYVEQFIEDNPYSIFPQVYNTERPDRVTAMLLEGRIAILVDNSPTSIVVPALFVEFVQASEDYYERTIFANYIRLMRYLALMIAISLPALYIALLSYQPELLPYDLLISLSRARMAVPFPVVIEALVMEIIIQIVIEAGLRLPTQIGQTVGVVSGIILGQAAISAKLASPSVILIISVSVICTYVLPAQSMVLTTRLLRLPMMLLAAGFGLFGLSFGWVILQAHLISLESIGVPYFAPIGPVRFSDMKDAFFRTFLWKMNQRPVSIPMQDRKRQANTGGGSNKSEG